MKGIIIYKSKYGATKRYANWLAEETGFDCIDVKNAKVEELKEYDTIIFGGGIHASGIAGLSFLKKNIDKLSDKKVVVFCVGASPYDEEGFKKIVAHNMTDSISNIPCFYCRGIWDLASMNFLDRTLCKMLQKALLKKDPNNCEVWEKALIEAGNKKCDWTDKSYLKPILKAIK